jgi:hypothetical protein
VNPEIDALQSKLLSSKKNLRAYSDALLMLEQIKGGDEQVVVSGNNIHTINKQESPTEKQKSKDIGEVNVEYQQMQEQPVEVSGSVLVF